MTSKQELKPNTFYIEVSGAGIPEVDGLFVPSTAPPAESESGNDVLYRVLERQDGLGPGRWKVGAQPGSVLFQLL